MRQASSSPPTCHHYPGAAAGQAHRTSGPRAETGCGHALPKKGGMPVVRGLLRPGSGHHDFSADRAGKAPAAATFPPLGPCRHSAYGIQLREPAVRTRHRLQLPGRGSSAGSAGPRASRKVRAQRQLETESKADWSRPLRTGPAHLRKAPRTGPPSQREAPLQSYARIRPTPRKTPFPGAPAGSALCPLPRMPH